MSGGNSNEFESPIHTVTIELREKHFGLPNKTKSKTKPWDDKIIETTSAICALFNSSCGGLLNLTFDQGFRRQMLSTQGNATKDKTIDDMVRRIEQSVLKFVGVATFSDAFKLNDINDDRLQFTVKPTHRFCTVEYHMYLPTDYQVNPITFGDSPDEVAALVQSQRGITEVTFREHCKEFRYKEKMPNGLREGQTVQFKHLKDDATSNVTLADRITNKSNKLVHYVSAFANHKGGDLYFGIDDKRYIVEGQVANERERAKIKNRVSNILSKMIWPVGDPTPFWKVDFVSVTQRQSGSFGYEIRHDTFVIVLSVSKCAGGVFVETPESYTMIDGRVARIPFPLWKEKIKAGSSKFTDNPGGGYNAVVPVVCKGVGTKGWSSVKKEEKYMKVTELMEDFRNNGNWSNIDNIASKVLTPQNTYDADFKLAVTFQCIAAAYRQNKHQEAYNFLQSYCSLVKQATNPTIFEVQELYSRSAIKRSERKYQESYSYAYDALQKMQLIVPGWITAWFLCNAASLLTMFASEEPNSIRKKALIGKAECYYRQALEHAQTIRAYKKAAANLHHRVHINLAMLYLASSPNFNTINFNQIIPPQQLKSAQESLKAAEYAEGPPMTGFNEFYFLLAKSDLHLRYFQQNPEENTEHVEKALNYANNAHKVAKDSDFKEVLHYPLSRITLLGNTMKEHQNATDFKVDQLLKDINI